MKKLFKTSVLLCLITALVMLCCACASDNNDEDKDKKTQANTAKTTQTATAAPTSEETSQPTQENTAPAGNSSTYSQEDFEITMTPGFVETELATATYFYISNDAALIIIKEDFTTLEQLSDLNSQSTLAECVKAVKANSDIEMGETMTANNGITYFTYENSALGQDFFYTATVCKGSDAFWLCTFYCPFENKAEFENVFLDWAGTIKVA